MDIVVAVVGSYCVERCSGWVNAPPLIADVLDMKEAGGFPLQRGPATVGASFDCIGRCYSEASYY